MSYIGPISVAAGSRIISPVGGGNPAGPNCVLLLHCDGANGSTSFPDSSGLNHTVTPVGSAAVNTSIVKFGTGSALITGGTEWLNLDGSTDFAFGTGDFTVDCWVYPTGVAGDCVISNYASGSVATGYAFIIYGGALYWQVNGANPISAVGTVV